MLIQSENQPQRESFLYAEKEEPVYFLPPPEHFLWDCEEQPEQLDLFRTHLPKKPYCTDNIDFGLSIYPAEIAAKKAFIQHNSPNDLRWMVYDIDRVDADFWWAAQNAPTPNIVALNRKNGHGHYFYGLKTPIYQQPSAHKGPMRYASAIDIALTIRLEADQGYGKLISKNPLRPDAWDIGIYEKQSYDLDWLSQYLDLGRMADKRTRLPDIGYGRNCNMFDELRRWAYRAIRESWLFDWESLVMGRAEYLNRQLVDSLPYGEVKSIARSVAKWTLANMSDSGFRRWGDNRRAKSARIRTAKSQEKAKIARNFNFQGFSPAEIAESLNISKMQVYRLNPELGKKSRNRAAEVQKLKSQGLNQNQIAKALGINQSQVSRLLQKNMHL